MTPKTWQTGDKACPMCKRPLPYSRSRLTYCRPEVDSAGKLPKKSACRLVADALGTLALHGPTVMQRGGPAAVRSLQSATMALGYELRRGIEVVPTDGSG